MVINCDVSDASAIHLAGHLKRIHLERERAREKAEL